VPGWGVDPDANTNRVKLLAASLPLSLPVHSVPFCVVQNWIGVAVHSEAGLAW
jgi:hypothetical protein